MEGCNISRSGGGGGDRGGQAVQVAPFVAKTYQMVSDARTDALIRWGREHNSFLVVDPADFSLLLLPLYFKHSNFSSFVRQLNTYGFRKVDPDRWEFAHESFLRGQAHLLPLIIRRKRKTDDNCEEEGGEEETLIKEIGMLRREQRALEEELQGMNKRLQATERRPHQLISFLVKVAEDPDLLNRLVLSKKQQRVAQPLKKPRVAADSAYCLPPLPQSIEDGGGGYCFATGMQSAGDDFIVGSGGQGVLVPEFGVADHANTAAYPFSLLGHVFF